MKQQFDAQGFVALPAFVSASEIEHMQRELDRYVRDVAPGLPSSDAFYETKGDAATLKQMMRMPKHDAYFAELLERSRFAELAAELLGTAAVPKDLQYFNKPPTASAATPPHQDGFYFMLEPNHALTMWLALDHVDQANGCVRYVPGSHRRGMRPHARTGVLGFSQGITDFGEQDREMEVAMMASPGDLLVHHSLTIHRADANRSARPRRSLGLVYYSADALQDAAAHAEYQRRLAEDLTRTGRI